MTNPADRPSRVVDQSGQGWYLAASSDGGTKYQASYGWQRDLPDMPGLDALAAARGPLRPVLPVTDADEAETARMLAAAGRKAIGSLAAAIWQVLREQAPRGTNPYGTARRALLAGREGSWESEALISVAVFGSGLKPSRADPAARDGLAAVITRWVTAGDRYTEVAETLAGIVSGYADREHGRDGWKRIADQWLQPGGMAGDDFRAAYRWLYSRSGHFDPDLT